MKKLSKPLHARGELRVRHPASARRVCRSSRSLRLIVLASLVSAILRQE